MCSPMLALVAMFTLHLLDIVFKFTKNIPDMYNSGMQDIGGRACVKCMHMPARHARSSLHSHDCHQNVTGQ